MHRICLCGTTFQMTLKDGYLSAPDTQKPLAWNRQRKFFNRRLALSTQQFLKNKLYLSLSENLSLIMETQ